MTSLWDEYHGQPLCDVLAGVGAMPRWEEVSGWPRYFFSTWAYAIGTPPGWITFIPMRRDAETVRRYTHELPGSEARNRLFRLIKDLAEGNQAQVQADSDSPPDYSELVVPKGFWRTKTWKLRLDMLAPIDADGRMMGRFTAIRD